MKVISGILWIGEEVAESAAATWTTEEVGLPTAIREGIGVVIVGVDGDLSNPKDIPAAGANVESVAGYCMEEEENTEPTFYDPDVFAWGRNLGLGDGTDLLSLIKDEAGLMGKIVDLEKGFVTGRNKAYIGVISSNAAIAASFKAKLWCFQVKLSQQELAELGFRESFE